MIGITIFRLGRPDLCGQKTEQNHRDKTKGKTLTWWKNPLKIPCEKLTEHSKWRPKSLSRALSNFFLSLSTMPLIRRRLGGLHQNHVLLLKTHHNWKLFIITGQGLLRQPKQELHSAGKIQRWDANHAALPDDLPVPSPQGELLLEVLELHQRERRIQGYETENQCARSGRD